MRQADILWCRLDLGRHLSSMSVAPPRQQELLSLSASGLIMFVSIVEIVLVPVLRVDSEAEAARWAPGRQELGMR